jgi:hypothetical protein
MMNMDKVICIGYFVAGYKKNNKFFLHWQNREKCPEVINTFNNRCANLILHWLLVFMQVETVMAHFENKLLHFIISESNTFIRTILNNLF